MKSCLVEVDDTTCPKGTAIIDRVLEIGPGDGALTNVLLHSGCEVLSVEVDERLASHIKERFANTQYFSLFVGDFLETYLRTLLEKSGWQESDYHVVANIPYYITAPIIRKLLTETPRPQSLTLLVQKEVAERILGEGDNRSILTVMAQYYADITLGPVIAREYFHPVPKVDSQVIRLIPKREPTEADQSFFHLVRAGFASRRKTLANNLASLPEISKGSAEAMIAALGWSPTIRAQELTIADWQSLQEALENSAEKEE